MFERIRRDLKRYFLLDSSDGNPSLFDKARILVNAPQIQAIAVYRFGKWINDNVTAKPVRYPLKAIYHLLDRSTRLFTGVHIDSGADIGGGLYIAHPSPMLIGPITMGVDCNVNGGVLIGRRTDGRGQVGLPTFGDRVWIGANSVVFGAIVVGSGATISPLTIVGRNVHPNSVVAGSPMQVLSKQSDNTRQIYGPNGPPP